MSRYFHKDKEMELEKPTPTPPFKQTCVVVTIMILSFLSEASTVDKDYKNYTCTVVAAVLFSLLVILTEYKGRKILFITLSSLSILSSLAFLTVNFPSVGHTLRLTMRGSTMALTGVVLCEYSEPGHRIFHLIVNSYILRTSYWVVWDIAQRFSEFENYLLFLKIVLGIVCLGSVFTWPESPYWLAAKGRTEDTKKAFLAIRSEDPKSVELRFLTDGKPQRGVSKMFYVPTLIGLPIVFIISTVIYDLEFTFFIDVTGFTLDGIWIYLFLNIIITAISVLIARKLSRRVLMLLPTATSTVCVIAIIFWDFALKHVVSREVNAFLLDYSFRFFYPVTICAITSLNYPIAIESIPCKYNNLLSGMLGLMYFVCVVICTEFMDIMLVLGFILVCLLVNSLIAYFILPEARGKSLIEIEQAYRKEVQSEETDLYS